MTDLIKKYALDVSEGLFEYLEEIAIREGGAAYNNGKTAYIFIGDKTYTFKASKTNNRYYHIVL